MIETFQLPRAASVTTYGDSKNKTSCTISKTVVGSLQQLNTSYTHGSTALKAALVKGNHIDDLPYGITVEEVDNIPWQARFEKRDGINLASHVGCGFTTRLIADSIDGRCIAKLSLGDLSPYVFTAAEREFITGMAELKAKANLRKGLINAPLLIAERVQTVKMISERVGDMIRVATSIQKRDLSKWKKLKSAKSRRAFAQKAASTHLEVIFGWMPVFEEIEGALEILMKPKFDYVRGRGRMTKLSPITDVPFRNRMPVDFISYLKRYSAFSVRTVLKAEITSGLSSDMQRLGFNPIYSLYDLTPLSFVSGWFSNFNYWVQSLDPLLGATYRTGSSSIRTSHVARLSTMGISSSTKSQTRAASGMGRSFASKTVTVRKVLSSEPESSFEFYNNLSAYSVFAGISLYLQRRLKPLERAIKIKPFRYKSKRPVNLPPIKYTGTIK